MIGRYHAKLEKHKLSKATSYYCFMQDFRDWNVRRGEPFPVPMDKFTAKLVEWRVAPDGMMNATMASMERNLEQM